MVIRVATPIRPSVWVAGDVAPVPQIVFLGLLFNVQGTLVNVAVALLASRTTLWLRANERRVSLLQRLTGGVFAALGLRLAISDNR